MKFFFSSQYANLLLSNSSSPPPLQPPSPSSQHPQRPSQPLRTPSPSSFLPSSSPAGPPLTPNPASAIALSTAAGDYSDNDHFESYYEEEDDAFSKPFHSPDTSTPSFPTLNPMSHRVRGPPLSFGPPLSSSSSLSPPTGGIPSASRSPTYLSPPHNTPLNSAHGPSQSSLGAFDNYSQPYNSYNPGHPRSFHHHDPPASTPYLPGLPFLLGAPPPPRRPSGPPSASSSASDPDPDPQRQAET